jgi:hypothetical protein
MATRAKMQFEIRIKPKVPPEPVAVNPISTLVHTGTTGDIRFARHLTGTTAHHPPSGSKSWLDYANVHMSEYGINQPICPCIQYTAAAVEDAHPLATKSVGAHVCVVLPTGEVLLGVTPTCSSCNTLQAALNEPFTLVTVASLACGTFAGTINPNTAEASSKRASVPELKKIHIIKVEEDGVTLDLSKLTLGGVIRDGTQLTTTTCCSSRSWRAIACDATAPRRNPSSCHTCPWSCT